jgi:hypothetical protein
MNAALIYCCGALLAGVGILLIILDVAKEIRRDKAVRRRRKLMEMYGFCDVRGTRDIKDQWIS